MEKRFVITAVNGLHARPATIIVNEAVKFDCDLLLGVDNVFVDLKSIMGVMSLGVYSNKEITIVANGSDEEEALEAITNVLKNQRLAKEL